MPEEKKLNRIGVDVDKETLKQVDLIADKERWPRTVVARVALESYLKKRGVRDE